MIKMIIFKNGNDDYEVWTGFKLSEEDEAKIMDVLSEYTNEGCSSRGTLEQIFEDLT